MTTHARTALAAFDRDGFENTVGHFPTGVVLVTAVADGGEPVGMVVGSFAAVSNEPPIVAFMPSKDSSSWARLRTASQFSVNLLSARQGALCRMLSRKGIADKFEGVPWSPAPSGAPLIEGAIAIMNCKVRSLVDAGDHVIVLGDVLEFELRNDDLPLLYFQGGLGKYATSSLSHGSDAELIESVNAAERARPELQALADLFGSECVFHARSGDAAVVVAVATAPGVGVGATVGARLPLIPPLGALWIAYSDETDTEAWLSRRHAADEVTDDTYRRRLKHLRELGWTIDATDYPEDKFYAALDLSDPEDLTPTQFRELRATVAGFSKYHASGALDAATFSQIAGLMVPVFAADGHVQLVLRVSQLPKDLSMDIDEVVATTRATADRVSQLLAQRQVSA